MKKKRIAIFLIILGLLLPGAIRSPISFAKGPKKVAIVPFAMHADRDLTFLHERFIGSALDRRSSVNARRMNHVFHHVDMRRRVVGTYHARRQHHAQAGRCFHCDPRSSRRRLRLHYHVVRCHVKSSFGLTRQRPGATGGPRPRGRRRRKRQLDAPG